MPSNYVELRIATSADAGELLALLHELEPLGGCEIDGVVHLYWPEDRWQPGFLERASKAAQLLVVNPQPPQISVHVLPDQDWNTTWAQSIEPIRIGRRIVIRQSWNAPLALPEAIELVIDPKRAFGTGYHATTQLLLEWLEDVVRGGEKVLDAGTGSGILAMAALRLGASSALGIDIDPEAIECAAECAIANHFGNGLDLRTGSIEEIQEQTFDLIVANLDRNTLLRHARRLVALLSDDGMLLASGLQPDDVADIEEVVRHSALIRAARKKDEWMALQITHSC